MLFLSADCNIPKNKMVEERGVRECGISLKREKFNKKRAKPIERLGKKINCVRNQN
jgi:hypothetical protein